MVVGGWNGDYMRDVELIDLGDKVRCRPDDVPDYPSEVMHPALVLLRSDKRHEHDGRLIVSSCGGQFSEGQCYDYVYYYYNGWVRPMMMYYFKCLLFF